MGKIAAMFRAAISLLIAGLIACGGCGPKTADSSPTADSGRQGRKLRIAVIPKGTTHEFWKSVHAGAEQAGKELGVEVIWKGSLKEDDRDSQIKVVEDFIAERVDGIVLAPLDDRALAPPVIEAQGAGIPVLIFDSDLRDVDVVSFVGTDNSRAGELGGNYLVEKVGKGARVILLRYQQGSASTTFREAGFLEAVQQQPSIRVVSKDQYAGATTESAQQAGENLIARFRKGEKFEVEGIFCPNESSTFGMLRALQDAGLAGKVILVGFDSSDALVQALRNGEISALVLQDPFKMGYLAVKTLVESLQGKSVQNRIDTGAVLATRENLDSPDVSRLIAAPKR
jgi:ribose transport system substrate-binding protein